MPTRHRWVAGALGAVGVAEAALIHLGRTYGSTAAERTAMLPGDRIVRDPTVVTDHAITIDAPPAAVCTSVRQRRLRRLRPPGGRRWTPADAGE
jgi:hypothetical protein